MIIINRTIDTNIYNTRSNDNNNNSDDNNMNTNNNNHHHHRRRHHHTDNNNTNNCLACLQLRRVVKRLSVCVVPYMLGVICWYRIVL